MLPSSLTVIWESVRTAAVASQRNAGLQASQQIHRGKLA